MAQDPWNILPGFLRVQELAAIEKAVDATANQQPPGQPQVCMCACGAHLNARAVGNMV